MFKEVKTGDTVYEDYYRYRKGVCKSVRVGPRGGVYAMVQWDDGPGLRSECGMMYRPIEVNASNLRATKKSKPGDRGYDYYATDDGTCPCCGECRG